MKKLLILSLLILLTSCGRMTPQEIEEWKKYCESAWQEFVLLEGPSDSYKCNHKQDKVMVCIKEYTNWLYEKYNNPDTVSNLKEENYSQAVKTCNEIFGNK